jgi:hypothetical protein
MSSKIYKMWKARSTAAWHELSEEEQNEIFAKNDADLEKLGVKTIILCDAMWSTEHWEFFGVEEYPDIEAVQAHAAYLNEINFFKYTEAEIMFGTELPAP